MFSVVNNVSGHINTNDTRVEQNWTVKAFLSIALNSYFKLILLLNFLGYFRFLSVYTIFFQNDMMTINNNYTGNINVQFGVEVEVSPLKLLTV